MTKRTFPHTVVLVRHGQNMGDELTQRGIRQIKEIAGQLQPLINGEPPLILSSPKYRAKYSAQIIRQILKLESEIAVETSLAFPDDFLGTEAANLIFDLLERVHSHDMVILVSHFEILDSFPPFLEATLGVSIHKPDKCYHGTACVIETSNGSTKILFPSVQTGH